MIAGLLLPATTHLRTSYKEPADEDQFPIRANPQKRNDAVEAGREQDDQELGDPAQACNDQEDADQPGKVLGLDDQVAQWQQPEAKEQLVNVQAIALNICKDEHQGVGAGPAECVRVLRTCGDR